MQQLDGSFIIMHCDDQTLRSVRAPGSSLGAQWLKEREKTTPILVREAFKTNFRREHHPRSIQLSPALVLCGS